MPGALMVLAASASSQDYADMHKQLDIMSDIMKSSVTVQDGRRAAKITGIDSTYLQGQGIVFTINSSSSSRDFGSFNFNFVMPEIPVMPIEPPSPEGRNSQEFFDIDVDESVSKALENASEGYERAIEVLHGTRDQFRELRDEQRDLAYEVRDIEREIRDIEYQLRRADKEKKNELDAEANKLKQQLSKIEQEKNQVEQKVTELKKQQELKNQEQAKERVAFYKNLTHALADTLCLYGNGLRTLPKDENVSLILKAAGDKDGRRYKDQIYVFNKKDITSCAMDKIDVAKLLEKGQGYQF